MRGLVDGWRDVEQPPGVRRLPRTADGIPISYTVMWSSESEPVARVDPLLALIGCDTPALCHTGHRGVGEPNLAVSNVTRQRRVAILGLCQVCGQELPRRRPRWLADLRNRGQEIKIGFRRVPLIVDGWTCEPCLRYSLQICPGLAKRRPQLLRVRDFELVATLVHVDALPEQPLVDWVKIAPTAFDWVTRDELLGERPVALAKPLATILIVGDKRDYGTGSDDAFARGPIPGPIDATSPDETPSNPQEARHAN